MNTGHPPSPAPHGQARQHLTALAAGFASHGISTRLTRVGGVPVLTIEEPTGGPNPTSISIDPDLTSPGLSLECTCLWTPAPSATPETIADTIIAVLNAVRPAAATGHPGREDLAIRFFRALYQEFDLRTIGGTYVAVPQGTPWFAGPSLSDIASQIRDHGHPAPSPQVLAGGPG